jgi:hypothetical protein
MKEFKIGDVVNINYEILYIVTYISTLFIHETTLLW